MSPFSSDDAGSLTDVDGVAVGHAVVPGGGSGCTVVLGPFRGAVEVMGAATGSRELHTLEPRHVVPRVDAVLLTGGSAFGLGAAQGVVRWLRAEERGYPTRVEPVPIVPGAVIYDLSADREKPGPQEGWRACEAANPRPVEEGRVGVGTGATVGKLGGLDRASPGGLGSASLAVQGWRVGALAVVNALGSVVDADGSVVAGVRDGRGGFLDADGPILDAGDLGGAGDLTGGQNTTLAVVATDAPASQVQLGQLARMASAALALRIRPVYTPFDGDLVFALSTASTAGKISGRELLGLGVGARWALEESIARGVR